MSRIEAERLQLDQEKETLEIHKRQLAEESRAMEDELRKMREMTDKLKQDLEEERERAKQEKMIQHEHNMGNSATTGTHTHEAVMRIPSISELGPRRTHYDGGGVCGSSGSLADLGEDIDRWSGAVVHNCRACYESMRDPKSYPEYITYDPGDSNCFHLWGCGVEPHNRRRCIVCRRMDLTDCPVLQ